MSDTPPVVEFKDVAIDRGGTTVWSHGTFSIPAGSVVAVIGPNGSGKTTLLHLLLGLLSPTAGRVRVLGDTPHRGDRRLGYVPQHHLGSVGGALRCRDLVALGLVGNRWGLGRLHPTGREAIECALRSVDASDFAGERVSAVSGGQQQRIAIAQALVHDPELLLLDEPLANLDLRHQEEMVGLLRDLAVAGDRTILVVTHDLNSLLPILTGAVYLLDGHAHYDEIGNVVDGELLSHLYGTSVRVVRTPQGDLFTRST